MKEIWEGIKDSVGGSQREILARVDKMTREELEELLAKIKTGDEEARALPEELQSAIAIKVGLLRERGSE